MKMHRYTVLLAGLTVGLLVTSASAFADKPAEDTDGAKWDPTEVVGPLADVGEVEPNGTPAEANAFNCGDLLRPATILPAADRDFIVFTANSGQVIQFGTDADGAIGQVGDTFIYLIASDGTTVLASDDDSGPNLYSLLTYTATYTGTYYGRINAFSATATGGYKAFVSCFDPIPPECPLAGYKGDTQTFPTPVPIPDNVPAGVLVGTIPTTAGNSRFVDVVVAISMSHTFIGDLIATVTYDLECDGTPEASARILCRPGRATCTGGTGAGCASNVSCNNTYYFSDAGAGELGYPPFGCGTTSTVIANGCYKPNATGEQLSVFDTLPKGGCFKLFMSDNLSADLGTVCAWSIYTLNEAIVPTENTTWGAVKTLYR